MPQIFATQIIDGKLMYVTSYGVMTPTEYMEWDAK